MNWFVGALPSAKELREQRALYLDVAHGTKKHVARTQVLLRQFWDHSKKRPHTDVWASLGVIEDVGPGGTITGAAIKYSFRKSLLGAQQGRCCYCRRWLVNTAYAKPIEHILPRSHYPQYSLDFWNLAVACTDCNGAKTGDVWGDIAVSRRGYPRPSEFAHSFHPRFHRYDEHVHYMRIETNSSSVVLFTGLTPQGRHLCESLLRRVAAKETLVTNNPVLAPLMTQIASFGAEAEGRKLQGFAAFREALDRSIVRLLEG